MTATVAEPAIQIVDADQYLVLLAYSRGASLPDIARDLDVTRDRVGGVVSRLCGFSQQRAAELARAYEQTSRPAPSPKAKAEVPTAPAGPEAALRAVARYALAALEAGISKKLLLAAVDEAEQIAAENAAARKPRPARARRTGRPVDRRCRRLDELAQEWAALHEAGHGDKGIAERLGYGHVKYMRTRIRMAREAGLLPERAA